METAERQWVETLYHGSTVEERPLRRTDSEAQREFVGGAVTAQPWHAVPRGIRRASRRRTAAPGGRRRRPEGRIRRVRQLRPAGRREPVQLRRGSAWLRVRGGGRRCVAGRGPGHLPDA